MIEHIPNSRVTENDFEEYDNQATVRFNVVEHTCEMKKLNHSFRGINDFDWKKNFDFFQVFHDFF